MQPAGPSSAPGSSLVTCDAVLFDMDGTLVDSRAIVERMWLIWADEHGIAHDVILKVAHGRRTYDTMALVAPAIATPDMAAQLDAREAEEEGGEVAIPGAAALLAALPPERWAVVTSAYHAIAAQRIASVGLPVPRVLVGADDVRAGKPDPEGYAQAAERLGHAASRCVVFEDTGAGIEAGRASGALVVALRTTYPELRGADIVIGDLRDVLVEPARGDGRIRLRLSGGS